MLKYRMNVGRLLHNKPTHPVVQNTNTYTGYQDLGRCKLYVVAVKEYLSTH